MERRDNSGKITQPFSWDFSFGFWRNLLLERQWTCFDWTAHQRYHIWIPEEEKTYTNYSSVQKTFVQKSEKIKETAPIGGNGDTRTKMDSRLWSFNHATRVVATKTTSKVAKSDRFHHATRWVARLIILNQSDMQIVLFRIGAKARNDWNISTAYEYYKKLIHLL